MKISTNWIRNFTDINLDNDELVKRIGKQLGEVEEVIDLGEKYQNVIIATVTKVEDHPDADKLHVVHLDDGRKDKKVVRLVGGNVQVVCGADNVKKGMKVAWLPPGSVVPETYGSDEPFVLEARELRGVVSNGMIASAKELGVGNDHDGILEVDAPATNGDTFADVYEYTNDLIIDIENKMFTHRPDCFGILGVARELAGIQDIQFTSPDWYQQQIDFSEGKGLPLHIRNKIPKLVPRFMAVAMKNISVQPSPVIMRSYLSRVGIKPVNNIVDITNFVMYVTAQPLHAFDYDKVAKLSDIEGAVIEIRKPNGQESLGLLNGKTIQPEPNDIMIATPQKVIGLGGVMGGSETEVDEQTVNIILECANFDMYTIRRTSMHHGLFTDAVTRYTKGQSPLQTEAALNQSISMVEDVASGKLASPVADSHSSLAKANKVKVSDDFINERLGTELDAKELAAILQNVEFEVATKSQQLSITPPFWRTDIAIAEDIVEEIGRLIGYDELPQENLVRSATPSSRSEQLAFKQRVREILSAAGANELLTYSFVHENLLDSANQDVGQAYKLSNALSPDLQYYRLTLTPSLLSHVHSNIKAGYEEFALFELNKTHNNQHADSVHKNLPAEINSLSLVYARRKQQPGAAFYTARAYLEALAGKLSIKLDYLPIKQDPNYAMSAPFDIERSAFVVLQGETDPIGIVGEYRAETARKLKLPIHSAGFEVSTEDLREAASTANNYQQISRFPSVEQDISLRIDNDVAFAELRSVISDSLTDNTPEGSYFVLEPLDIYRPEKKDYKQIAFRLTITSYTRTLQAEEVNDLLDQAAEAAGKTLKAKRV